MSPVCLAVIDTRMELDVPGEIIKQLTMTSQEQETAWEWLVEGGAVIYSNPGPSLISQILIGYCTFFAAAMPTQQQYVYMLFYMTEIAETALPYTRQS